MLLCAALPLSPVTAHADEPANAAPAADAGVVADAEATGAQDTEASPTPQSAADRLYGEVASLRELGDDDGACARLYGAVSFEPRPRGLYELGVCFQLDGDPTTALELFGRARAMVGEAPAETLSMELLERAEAEILATTAAAVVDTSAIEEGAWVAVTIDGRQIESARIGGTLRLAPGTHVVHAERPGCARWHGSVECAAAASCEVEVPALSCVGEAVALRKSLWRRRTSGRLADNPYSRAGMWLGGVGAAVVLVGIVQWRQWGSEWDHARALGCNRSGQCPNSDGDAYVEASRRKKTYAVASLVGGGLVLVAATSLVWYGLEQVRAVERKRKGGVAVVPLVGDEPGALVSVEGVF